MVLIYLNRPSSEARKIQCSLNLKSGETIHDSAKHEKYCICQFMIACQILANDEVMQSHLDTKKF